MHGVTVQSRRLLCRCEGQQLPQGCASGQRATFSSVDLGTGLLQAVQWCPLPRTIKKTAATKLDRLYIIDNVKHADSQRKEDRISQFDFLQSFLLGLIVIKSD